MKIDLSDKVIMSAALDKVNEGEFFDALCLFARVDSYESMLNQIGCLCQLRDIGYAIDTYRKVLARFCYTHNVYSDVRSLGDATEMVMAYFGNELKGELSQEDAGKYSADESLLGEYSLDFDDEFFYDDVDYLADTLENWQGAHSKFYDVKSPDYFRVLRMQMERAYVEGNLLKGKELQRQYMSIDTNDEETLEAQLYVALTQQLWDEGVRSALRVANLDDVGYRAMGAAVQILARVEGYNEVCEKLLGKLSRYGEEISDGDMMEYVRIAAAKLGYGELTLKLNDVLFSHYKDAGCEALSLCAKVYFNCRKYHEAREAVLTLLRAVPTDSAAVTLLTYINNGMTLKLDDVSGYNSLAQHYDVPTQLSVVAQYALLRQLEQNDYRLAAEYYPYIDCLSKLCVSAVIKGNGEKFLDGAMVLSAILSSVTPQDKESFIDVIRMQLCKALPEPTVNKEFLKKLISLGYGDKVLVALSRGFYTLNLSGLTLLTDNIFVEALTLCATLRRVDAKRLEKSYKQLKSVCGEQLHSGDADNVRQVAYCLLAMSYKHFTESNESAYFGEEERALYLTFIASKD